MSRGRRKTCGDCDGAGEKVIPYNSLSEQKYYKCYHCDGSGTNPERWTSDYENARYLSNNSNESEPVAVSNMRVWREAAAESENKLWRVETGSYGGVWIELDKRLDVPNTHLKSLSRRAWDMGADSVGVVVDMLLKLDSYPILDEDDESQAEMEEQQEHWEGYGRSDFFRLVDNVLDNAVEGCPLTNGAPMHYHFKQTDLESMDDIYGRLCNEASFWPERIDSSAWNFGLEAAAAVGGQGSIYMLMQEKPWLIYPEQRAQTLKDYIIAHQGETLPDEVLVSLDMALERGEVDEHIAGEMLSKRESTPTQELP